MDITYIAILILHVTFNGVLTAAMPVSPLHEFHNQIACEEWINSDESQKWAKDIVKELEVENTKVNSVGKIFCTSTSEEKA